MEFIDILPVFVQQKERLFNIRQTQTDRQPTSTFMNINMHT